jgi:hypothetical protein
MITKVQRIIDLRSDGGGGGVGMGDTYELTMLM